MKLPFERECMYCGAFFVPNSSKQIYCQNICASRHYKERVKRRKLSELGFDASFPIKPIIPKELYTIYEASLLLGISKQALSRLIKKNQIKTVKSEGLTKITYVTVNQLLKSRNDEY